MKSFTKLSTTALAAGFVLTFSAGAALASAHEHKQHGAKMFEMMDTDGNGKISRDEMKAHHEARKNDADTDGDGKVSKDEFKAAAQKKHDAHVKKKFSRMDKNGDGFLTEDDKGKRADKMGDHMFKKMDKDGDGEISKDEAKAMHKMHRKGGKGCKDDGGHHGEPHEGGHH